MIPLPIAKKHLLHRHNQGRVVGLLNRPGRNQPVQLVESWDPGGPSDHSRSDGKRAVTLLQKEGLLAAEAMLGRPIPWQILRRNILVEHININTFVGYRFQVGGALLEGTCLCDPCHKMEEALGEGAYAALLGHSGICARIIESGPINMGDALSLAL
jgi:MOSC domain-containing protein YiiM